MSGISWGVYSITLLIGSVQGLILCCLLLSAKANRAANRSLAVFIFAVVLQITPYTLGFSGFYDKFRWLNFAPFFWELGFSPLIWLYVRQLGHCIAPRGWPWHFVPVALQGAYYLIVCIGVPTALKETYNDQFHVVWAVPILALVRCASYAVYAIATAREFRAYQHWLAHHSGQREEYRLRWLSRLLLTIGGVLLLDALVTLLGVFVQRLPYVQEFPLYVAFAVLAWVLGLEGWRHATSVYPKMDAPEELADVVGNADAAEPIADAPRRTHDWQALAGAWIAQIKRDGWYLQPDLNLALVARRLGTNNAYLSRALNEGARQSFSDCINRLRIDAAKERLAGQSNILDIAFDVGFASKASFNRVFKATTGQTPTEYREQQRGEGLKS